MATLVNTTINDTGFLTVASGTTAQRSGSPVTGMTRYNTSINAVEVYNGTYWYTSNLIIPVNQVGLVSYLDAGIKASYPGSGTTWFDLSGLGNNGTLVNSPIYASTYGGQFSFNKSTTYISLPTGLLTSNDFTIIMWVLGDGTGAAQTIFANYPSSNLQLFYGTSYVGMYLGNVSAYANAATWYSSQIVQFTAIRSGTTTQVFINNNLAVTGSSSSATGSSLNAFRIGTNTSGGEQYGGTVFTCQVYNRALTTTEITNNYSYFRARFGV